MSLAFNKDTAFHCKGDCTLWHLSLGNDDCLSLCLPPYFTLNFLCPFPIFYISIPFFFVFFLSFVVVGTFIVGAPGANISLLQWLELVTQLGTGWLKEGRNVSGRWLRIVEVNANLLFLFRIQTWNTEEIWVEQSFGSPEIQLSSVDEEKQTLPSRTAVCEIWHSLLWRFLVHSEREEFWNKSEGLRRPSWNKVGHVSFSSFVVFVWLRFCTFSFCICWNLVWKTCELWRLGVWNLSKCGSKEAWLGEVVCCLDKKPKSTGMGLQVSLPHIAVNAIQLCPLLQETCLNKGKMHASGVLRHLPCECMLLVVLCWALVLPYYESQGGRNGYEDWNKAMMPHFFEMSGTD